VPIMEITPWTSFSKICSNDALTIVEYKEYNLSSLSVLSPHFLYIRMSNCNLGSGSRKLATVVAQMKTLKAQGTRYTISH